MHTFFLRCTPGLFYRETSQFYPTTWSPNPMALVWCSLCPLIFSSLVKIGACLVRLTLFIWNILMWVAVRKIRTSKDQTNLHCTVQNVCNATEGMPTFKCAEQLPPLQSLAAARGLVGDSGLIGSIWHRA